MQHKGGPRLLITDREGALYLERAKIHVDNGRIVYHIADDEQAREYNIPHVNLAVLFMGQGTSITQDAMRLLGEEKVHIAVTGTGGSPIHVGSLIHYTATRHFIDMLPIYQSEDLSLVAAKTIMTSRTENMRRIGAMFASRALKQRDVSSISRVCKTFDENIAKCTSIKDVLSAEGVFAKSMYAVFAEMTRHPDYKSFRRDPGAGSDDDHDGEIAAFRHVNRLIDHGNYLCYGMAGAALWALGIPPHMAVLHGKTRAGGLVFDLADSFKDAFVLPLAFSSILPNDQTSDDDFRARLIAAFNDKRVLAECIATIERMISACRTDGASQHA
jgi:CRISPR-associated protein Cas1